MELDDNKRKLCTLLLIQNDCETIKSIILKYRESIFNMCIIPYLALFCRSVQEYIGSKIISPEVDSEIYDIRNSIKTYSERYSKNKRRFLYSDESQDNEFRDMLRFDFTKNLNIHYNLGLYFDKNSHIIGDTQYIADFLNLNELSQEERAHKTYSIGYHLASVISGISNGLSESLVIPTIHVNNFPIDLYYYDINTNKTSFFNPIISKDMNLYFLHLLSIVGFVKYILESVVEKFNPWILRIKYLVSHYAYFGLRKASNHMKDKSVEPFDLIQEIDDIIKSGEPLFASEFRNCMMHYDLIINDVFAISDTHFDINKTLYGLVEECFEGISTESYFGKIDAFILRIEKCLANQFNYKRVHVQPLN